MRWLRRFSRGLALYSVAYFVILELMLVAAIFYWPHFEDNIEHLRPLAAPIPMLQNMLGQLEEAGVVGYVVGQHFFKGCNTLGTAAAALFAAGAVAGEVHRGTFEIWISRPYSRLRLLCGRWLAGVLATVLPVFVSTATIPWLVDRVGEELQQGPLLLCAVHQSLLLVAIYSATFLLSSLGSNPTKIALVVLFLTTFEFALYMVAQATHWSLFRLSDVEVYLRVFESGTLEPGITVPLAAFTAAALVSSALAFRRRVP